MRTARARIACRSVPQSGSVRARPPRSSPAAKRGRKERFWASVPKRCTAAAIIRCELNTPESDIQTSDMRATMRA